MPGTAWRNSPKVILTEPNASCVTTFSNGMETIVPGGGFCMTLARKSIGIAARMGCSGNCKWSELSSGTGGTVDTGLVEATGARCRDAALTGAAPVGSTTLVRICGTGEAGASLSSSRRSSPRSNPANFVLTLLDMTLIHLVPSINRQVPWFQQEASQRQLIPMMGLSVSGKKVRPGGEFVSALD